MSERGDNLGQEIADAAEAFIRANKHREVRRNCGRCGREDLFYGDDPADSPCFWCQSSPGV